MKNYRIIQHENLYLKFIQTEKGWFLNQISSDADEPTNDYTFTPFVVCTSGLSVGSFGGDVTTYKNNLCGFTQTEWDFVEGEYLKILYECEALHCKAEVVYEFVKGASAFYQKVNLTATEKICITDFYSFFPLVGYSGMENEDYRLSYRRNRWEAEGQWYESAIKDLGFVEYTRMPSLNKFTVSAVSSQTTGAFYPSMILKHRPSGKTWFLENEADGCWFMELSEYRSFLMDEMSLCLSGGDAEERALSYRQTLEKGECRETPRSLFAVSNGKCPITREIYTAKRSVCEYSVRETTVCFNDYMNCRWANLDWESEKALIDCASEINADYFIIDDGWFLYKNEIGNRLGDWNTDGEVFGEIGLKGVIEYIRSKGMKAGIWIEFEVAGKNSVIYQNHRDWLLTVCGDLFGSESRYFLDFRKKEVWEYLFERVQAVYDLGIRYIKTDYNDSYSETDAKNGERRFGLYENYNAIRAFYRELKRRFPDMILENCASGGKREDDGMLKNFDLQSISDQEHYANYPSVICGTYINALPEKIGVWCMPYPARFREREKPLAEIAPPKDEEVIFNLVNGMSGLMCVSTALYLLSDGQKALVKEALESYKTVFPILCGGYPQYPLGLTHIGDTRHALLFKDGEKEVLYLYATGEKEFSIKDAENFEQFFPRKQDCEISSKKIVLPFAECARIFIRKKN